MSRRPKETLAVQLFPFLAVLVCTMGSLIFLLLVTTREVRQRAIAFATFRLAQQTRTDDSSTPLLSITAPEPALEEKTVLAIPAAPVVEDDGYEAALADRERELSDLKATWQLKAKLLAKDRDQQKEMLVHKKSIWDVVIEGNRALETEVQQLEGDLGLLAAESAVSTEKTDEAERKQLEQQIAFMRKRLKAAQLADSTSSNDQFQVIPFDPQTGTTRRPILIECTAAGIRFLPEDILITASDLEGFTHKVNPLAAGTGALINYWTVWNMKQRDPRSEPEPYVLMLVRPDGVYAYYVAMKMLDPIRTARGYELVEESAVLKLPDVDFGAKTACQAAVDRLLSERERIYRTAVNSGEGGNVFGGVPGRRADGPGRPIGAPAGEPGSAGSESRRASGNAFTLSDITGGDNAVGSRSWERVENFQGRPRRSGNGGTGMPDGQARSGSSRNGVNPLSGDEAPGELPEESDASSPTSVVNGQSGGRGEKGTRGAASPDGLADGRNSFDTLPPAEEEPEPGMPIGERPGRKSKSAKSSGNTFDGTASSQGSSASEESTNEQERPQGASGGSPSPSRPGRLSDTSGSGRRFPHIPGSPARAARPGERPPKSDMDPDKPLEPEMLAGRRWGYHEAGASIGFEREVRVDVFEDKMILAEKHVIPMGQGDSKAETLERVAMALDLCSREWGRPPQGFFWAPRLKFVVRPEGNAHYEQVNAMMTRAGLGTSHEFAKEPSAVPYGRSNSPNTKPVPKMVIAPKTGGQK